MTVVAIETANEEQAQEWDGDEGEEWVEYEEHYNEFARYYQPVLEEGARVAQVDSVLDIGCGCGESTRLAARAAHLGRALGVDLSTRMIERARERATQEGLNNAFFEQADAQVHRFVAGSFDVAISRFGGMFFGDLPGAFRNIGAGMKPGGRLALISWQGLDKNEWLRVIIRSLTADAPPPPPGSPGPDSFQPFALADPDRVRHILTEAGWRDIEIIDVNQPVVLGSDPEDAFTFFRDGVGVVRGLLSGLEEPERAKALDRLHQAFAAHHTKDGVLMDSRSWLILASRAHR